MKLSFVFGFILMILLIIGIFVGLPYAAEIVKSGSFALPFPLPKISINRASNYFPNPFVYTGLRTQQMGGQQASKARIGAVYYSSNQQQINVTLPYSNSPPINITGWKIKTLNKGETIIGKAVNLPQLDTTSSDIWLKNGNSADIIVGKSPLAVNFHVNNCFGWLSNIYNLDYSLNYCSYRFNFGDLAGLDSVCQDLILSYNSCRAPSDDILNKNSYSYQCRQWVEKNMNYNTCVTKNIADPNFYRGWKIYTGNNNQIFDPLHDKIELRDQNGFLVDSYEY